MSRWRIVMVITSKFSHPLCWRFLMTVGLSCDGGTMKSCGCWQVFYGLKSGVYTKKFYRIINLIHITTINFQFKQK